MVRLRLASWLDAWRLYRWRTDAVTARMMLQPPPRTFLHHLWWLRRTLKDKTCRLYIAETVTGLPVGTGRIDFDRSAAVLSVTVSPRHRGVGLARHVIAALLGKVLDAGCYSAVAKVKPGNAASLRAFARAGFIQAGTQDETCLMTWPSRLT